MKVRRGTGTSVRRSTRFAGVSYSFDLTPATDSRSWMRKPGAEYEEWLSKAITGLGILLGGPSTFPEALAWLEGYTVFGNRDAVAEAAIWLDASELVNLRDAGGAALRKYVAQNYSAPRQQIVTANGRSYKINLCPVTAILREVEGRVQLGSTPAGRNQHFLFCLEDLTTTLTGPDDFPANLVWLADERRFGSPSRAAEAALWLNAQVLTIPV